MCTFLEPVYHPTTELQSLELQISSFLEKCEKGFECLPLRTSLEILHFPTYAVQSLLGCLPSQQCPEESRTCQHHRRPLPPGSQIFLRRFGALTGDPPEMKKHTTHRTEDPESRNFGRNMNENTNESSENAHCASAMETHVIRSCAIPKSRTVQLRGWHCCPKPWPQVYSVLQCSPVWG